MECSGEDTLFLPTEHNNKQQNKNPTYSINNHKHTILRRRLRRLNAKEGAERLS